MHEITIFCFLTALFFLVLEMGSPGLFYFLSFFFGALAAAAASLVNTSLILLAGIFSGVSSFSFFILKYWVKKQSRHVRKTNVAALIGKRGIVMQTISATKPGAVKVGGEVWSARCHQGVIKEGAAVEVQQITGAYLVVVEVKNF